MKFSCFTLLAVILVVAAIVCAGCSSATPKSTASAGNTGSAVTSGTAAANSGGSCPAVTSATTWSGKWIAWGYSDPCFDARVHFYPPTTDNPTPWDSTMAGVMDLPVSLTQNGCDVTGSITVGPNGTLVAQPGCPITLTGKVDSTGAVAGTWHAYCNINLNGATSSDSTVDSGSWSLNMEPGGSTFIGSFGVPAADLAKYKADNCASANSNWVGKRG